MSDGFGCVAIPLALLMVKSTPIRRKSKLYSVVYTRAAQRAKISSCIYPVLDPGEIFILAREDAIPVYGTASGY